MFGGNAVNTATAISLKTIQPRDIKYIVKEVPTLPSVYQELFNKMSNPNVSVPQLAEIVSRDQALATKILKLVNSAFYGYKGEINTISRAMVILGFRTVRNAALAISVFDYVKNNGDDTNFPIEDFWKHSLCTASICKVLGKHCGVKQQEETFVAGLLHDIGKLIMKKYFEDDFNEVCNYALNHGVSWNDAENKLLNVSHANLAKVVLRSWNFPPSLIEAIQFHHTLSSGITYPKLVALVNVADHISYRDNMGAPASLVHDDCDQAALSELGLTIEKAESYRDEYHDEIELSLQILKIIE
jgi:putative nucleotidyltransferase with HDIG domain